MIHSSCFYQQKRKMAELTVGQNMTQIKLTLVCPDVIKRNIFVKQVKDVKQVICSVWCKDYLLLFPLKFVSQFHLF